MTPAKSTVEEIRQRFDADVERFSNLETGQPATVDDPLPCMLMSPKRTRHGQSRFSWTCSGFNEVDVLHKNSCFAAFGAVKR